ncbi:hypothetical protein AXX17_AT4G04540 [Arabidopsis thaliana]|uniref:Uncharacterized protein n=1 Tax=Arabidopsis thaliana TaxID=3702 RepID=A0A178UZ47_ARATH|nr:hypothetical protein AXX17_AT4G04540 [Arabidopsis thaliana]
MVERTRGIENLIVNMDFKISGLNLDLQQLQKKKNEEQEEEEEDLFGDGGLILTDWTTSHLIDDPIDQYKDTCSSVVFTRLTHASYNKDRHIAPRQNMSYRDLAEYLKGKSKGRKLSFRNLNEPIKYIQNVGLLKDVRVKTKGNFDNKLDATTEFIYEILETTPLEIVLEAVPEFCEVRMMVIYHVPAVITEKCDAHVMFVVAKDVIKAPNGESGSDGADQAD